MRNSKILKKNSIIHGWTKIWPFRKFIIIGTVYVDHDILKRRPSQICFSVSDIARYLPR